MTTDEMTADLREIITCDAAAAVTIAYNGRSITGTRGDFTNAGTLDRDDGGIYSDDQVVATFVLADFPVDPDGTEIVMLAGSARRISHVRIDDYRIAVALTFSTPNEQ